MFRRNDKALRVAAALGLGACAVWMTSTPARARPLPVKAEPRAIFNDPNSGKKDISTALRDLIKASKPNSTIKIAIWLFADRAIQRELERAHYRQVNVKIIADSTSKAKDPKKRPGPWEAIQSVLKEDTTKRSWALICEQHGGGSGCAVLNPRSQMHNKFALFSDVRGKQVVFQTSANFVPDLSGTKGRQGRSGDGNWNDAVIVPGNTSLYRQYSDYFELLTKQATNREKHPAPVLQSEAGAFAPYFFPWSGQQGDIIRWTLRTVVNCAERNSGGRRTVVRVAMTHFTLAPVAWELRNMAARGCEVQVIYRNDEGTITNEVKRALEGTRVRTWSFPELEKYTLHSKYLIVDGHYGGKSDQKLVWTGSLNYTEPALLYNDEVLLRINHPGIHGEYVRNFQDMVAAIERLRTRRYCCE